MNEQKLTKYLASYKEWLTQNPSAANEAKQEDSTIIQDVMLSQHITNLESRILQYQQSINDTVKSESDTVNDTATRLIALIKAHPEYTYDEYAKVLNIGRATVARHIKKLNGTIIKRIGSDKDGRWEFIIKEQ